MRDEPMTDTDLRFVTRAYDINGKSVGEAFSFSAGDRADINEQENPLFEHLYQTLEEYQEEA
jgi:hypothetical protein